MSQSIKKKYKNHLFLKKNSTELQIFLFSLYFIFNPNLMLIKAFIFILQLVLLHKACFKIKNALYHTLTSYEEIM